MRCLTFRPDLLYPSEVAAWVGEDLLDVLAAAAAAAATETTTIPTIFWTQLFPCYHFLLSWFGHLCHLAARLDSVD